MTIFYTGIGSNKTGLHTEKEFLYIMNSLFTHKNWNIEFRFIPRENHYQLKFKHWILPNDFILFTLNEWIEYSGAEICGEMQ